MNFRSLFPYFESEDNPVYLDSAATSQKPHEVIDSVNEYLISTANPGRGAYARSRSLSQDVEDARYEVANFFGVEKNDLAFTYGTTHGMNLIAKILDRSFLGQDDEILLCKDDHKATNLPWSNISKCKTIEYGTNPFTGLINKGELLDKITEKTKIVVLTHANNIFGTVNDVKEIVSKLPDGILTVLDMAQTAGHIQIDINDLGVDFALFSGHKMFALEGTGGLICSKNGKEYVNQIDFGGGVEESGFPYILEVGTKNTVGIISLKSAIRFIKSYGLEKIHKNVSDLAKYTVQKLVNIESVELLPGVGFESKLTTTGIISFCVDSEVDVVSMLMEENGVNLRVGKHCTENSHDSVRVSLHGYSNTDDIDKFLNVVTQLDEQSVFGVNPSWAASKL